MTTVRKFTFDLDFDAPEEPVAPEPEVDEEEEEEVIPTFSEEEVEQARAEGFDAGKEAGRREAADATEQRLLETVEDACTRLADIYNTQTEANREIGREMISVATAIAKKMFPDLNARNALGEVERVVQETLKAVTEEPRIQIMVNPELREPLSERLTTMTHRAGFEGKVFVNPDPSMQLGDCRIEWSNGAAVRDSEEMWQLIDRIIEENLHDAPDDGEADDDRDAPRPQAREPEPAPESDPEPESEPEAEASAPAADAEPMPLDQPEEDAAEPAPETGDTPDTGDTVDDDAPEAAMDPETAGIEETPSWQDAVGESTGANAAPEAAPISEPEPAPEPETAPDMPEGDDAGAHGPSFAPSMDEAGDPADNEKSEPEQSLNMEDREAPIPHLDDDADGTGDAGDGDDAPAPRVSDPDPVSPATQAAILDAQSAMDDDDKNPSGG